MRSRTSPISRPVTIRRAVAPATAAGYRRLLDWSGKRGTVRRAGVDGTGTFGAGLSRFLLAERVQVYEVNRPDRSARRLLGKSHPLRRHLADHHGRPLERLNTEASFAALCGVSLIEYSSGRRTSRRLSRGGNRQANAALHRIVFTRLRFDPRTLAYHDRRTQEGKTRREIIRCLKRYAAREVFNLVRPVSSTPS
ncbi:transposase [Streptomyces massasporeus]|uniref:transposase n=1 Tax=Streptomyces massasporeus TaxID=67324 RepID=UPI0037107B7D